MIRSQAIKLIGVDDRFTETGHVVVDGTGFPEVVTLNGDCFVPVGELPPAAPAPTDTIQYRKVHAFRFVRKALP
jgi:hypothetical protein